MCSTRGYTHFRSANTRRSTRCVGSAKDKVRPISPGDIWHIVNQLYIKAGLITPCNNQHKPVQSYLNSLL